ncbi:MAG: glutamine-hydrolyzing carbamoyl-phosphate synthase small subunit [Deltaproteobacteria bacterium]|nr:glutamine-hydrolyzing carbamoyl-phosphate synthase small subunit [Deltaproteobacteria bacterium]
MKPAWLVLADGTIFSGLSIGADGEVAGEVVFQTGMSGYQEVITDPSYSGQIVVFTAAHIGNVGVNPADMESRRPWVRGLVMRDYCSMPSNWRATQPLHRYLKQHGIVAIEGVDTRTVTRTIRRAGAMPAMLTTHAVDPGTVIARAAALPGMSGQELVRDVTRRTPTAWTEGPWNHVTTIGGAHVPCGSASGYFLVHPLRGSPDSVVAIPPPAPLCGWAVRIAVLDFGVKENILRELVARGCQVTVWPATTPAKAILATDPDGCLFSNGPGDPAAVDYAIATVRALLPRRPALGICLGHQLMALAVGGRTYKLPFGHHGANQPVKTVATGRVAITSQNHGFAVDPDSLPAGLTVTHVNLNDGTVEGFCATDAPHFAVQYHPEASPGPHDSAGIFDQFVAACQCGRGDRRQPRRKSS